MKLSLIVAASENNVIGRDGDLPWRLSSDLKRFKQLTMGHCLIMGRKTYESIGRPLPGRVSIVLSREPASVSIPAGKEGGHPGQVLRAEMLNEALSLVSTTEMEKQEAFVVGGGEIYKLALPWVDRLYITRVHFVIRGDAKFPEIDPNEWKLISTERHPADEKNEEAYSFEVWERVHGHQQLG